jgi:hypothetical protein
MQLEIYEAEGNDQTFSSTFRFYPPSRLNHIIGFVFLILDMFYFLEIVINFNLNFKVYTHV